MKKLISALVVILAVYVLSYGVFRSMNQQVWDKDGRTYLIFPKDRVWVYYVYRPMTYIDGAATGMNFHIGPHE